MGVKKFPLGRKLESALQLDLDTYKSMKGRGKGRPDCTKLGRGKQHDWVSRCQRRNGKWGLRSLVDQCETSLNQYVKASDIYCRIPYDQKTEWLKKVTIILFLLLMVLWVDRDQLGSACSGFLISDFHDYSQMVTAVGVISKASLLLPHLGLSAKSNLSMWPGSFTG